MCGVVQRKVPLTPTTFSNVACTASPFEEVGPGVSQTRYASFDNQYKVDFSEKLEKYLKDNPQVKVIADFRDR